MKRFLVPIIATYAVLGWWAFALVVPVRIFAGVEHVRGAIAPTAIFNVVLLIALTVTWTIASFWPDK